MKSAAKRNIKDTIFRYGNVRLFLGLDNHYLLQASNTNNVTYSHATFVLKEFIKAGLVENVTPKKRHHIYMLTAKGKKIEQLLLKSVGDLG